MNIVARRETASAERPRAASVHAIGRETRKLAQDVAARLVELVSAGEYGLDSDAAVAFVEQHVLAPRRAPDEAEAEDIIRDTLREHIAAAPASVPLNTRLASALAAGQQRSRRDEVRDALLLLDAITAAEAERERIGADTYEAVERERERIAAKAADAQRLLNDPVGVPAEAARRVEAVYASIRHAITLRLEEADRTRHVEASPLELLAADIIAALPPQIEREEQDPVTGDSASREAACVEWPPFPGSRFDGEVPAVAVEAFAWLVRERRTLRARDLHRLLAQPSGTKRDKRLGIHGPVQTVLDALLAAGWRVEFDMHEMAPNVVHLFRAVAWARAANDAHRKGRTANGRKTDSRARAADRVEDILCGKDQGAICRACGARRSADEKRFPLHESLGGGGKHRTMKTDQLRAAVIAYYEQHGKAPRWVEMLCPPCHEHQSRAERAGAPFGVRRDVLRDFELYEGVDPDYVLRHTVPAAAPDASGAGRHVVSTP